jgi:hypothetical protein
VGAYTVPGVNGALTTYETPRKMETPLDTEPACTFHTGFAGPRFFPDSSNLHFFRIVLISGGNDMTKKSLILLGVLAMLTLPIASAKSYTISLGSPTVVGSAQLSPGEYTLKVEGSNAVFTKVDSSKSVTAPVKIENADHKFDVTSVESTQEGNAQHIRDIQLGGSTTKLDFN